jgi:hypothetical protein
MSGPVEIIVITDEELAAHKKAMKGFKELGFMETEADLLASAGARPSEAYSLLIRGCSHKYAVLILI